MKVLFLNHETVLGGAEVMLLRFVRGCDRSIFSFELIVPKEGPLVEEFREAGEIAHVLPLDSGLLSVRRGEATFSVGRVRSLLKSVRQLRAFIVQQNPDVVVSNSIKADLYGSLAMRSVSIPFGWRLHDIVDSRSFSFVQRHSLYWLARKVPLSIAGVSNAVCLPLIDAGVSRSKTNVIYNGVEPLPKPGVDEVERFRSQMGLKPKSEVITLPSRIMPSKGHDIFVTAAKEIAASRPHAMFLCAGDYFPSDKGYRSQLEQKIESLGLKDRFVFAGFRKDMNVVYSASDIVVLPSLKPDSLPTVLIEAMSMGKVVIASDAGGASEIIDDQKDGYIVPIGDPIILAKRIIQALGEFPHLNRLQSEAELKVREKFGLDRYIHSFEKWLTDLAKS